MKKDYTTENYERLFRHLTMDEVGNFMDCLPRAQTEARQIHDRDIADRKHPAHEVLNLSFFWINTKFGREYWRDVHTRLREIKEGAV